MFHMVNITCRCSAPEMAVLQLTVKWFQIFRVRVGARMGAHLPDFAAEAEIKEGKSGISVLARSCQPLAAFSWSTGETSAPALRVNCLGDVAGSTPPAQLVYWHHAGPPRQCRRGASSWELPQRKLRGLDWREACPRSWLYSGKP